jgi:hypothetical protein
MTLLIGWGEVMTESNILPYDGEAILMAIIEHVMDIQVASRAVLV